MDIDFMEEGQWVYKTPGASQADVVMGSGSPARRPSYVDFDKNFAGRPHMSRSRSPRARAPMSTPYN